MHEYGKEEDHITMNRRFHPQYFYIQTFTRLLIWTFQNLKSSCIFQGCEHVNPLSKSLLNDKHFVDLCLNPIGRLTS